MPKTSANAEREMDGVEKAAILLIALGPEKSAQIFKHLKEEEIEQLTLEIANTSSVSPQTKEQVLNEFYEVCLAQQYIAEGGITYAKELLEKARKENFGKNAFNWGIGFAISAAFLSTFIPKIQYWITRKATGSNAFPGTADYSNEKK